MPIVDDPVRLRRDRRDQRASPTSTRWAARRCSRWRWSACRSTSCRSRRSARILDGGEAVCARAGIPIAGGHTIDSVEPIYGLVAIGLVDPRHLKRNAGAQPGDALVLGKPLGVGIYSAALKKGRARRRRLRGDAREHDAAQHAGHRARRDGRRARADRRHRLRPRSAICSRSAAAPASARRSTSRACRCIPACSISRAQGLVTGASARNWAGYGDAVDAAPHADGDVERALLTDPQTSGGLAGRVRARCASTRCSPSFAPKASTTRRSSARSPPARRASSSARDLWGRPQPASASVMQDHASHAQNPSRSSIR